MTFYLLRHASTTANEEMLYDSRRDSALSANGRTQASGLVSSLSEYKYDAIFVTPLSRTRETLAPYVKAIETPLPPIIEEVLMIERDLGEITGRNQGEGAIEKDMVRQNVTDRFAWIPPGGESLNMVMSRVQKFYERLKQDYAGKSVLIVSHRNPLRCLELIILGRPMADYDRDDPPKQSPATLRVYEI